MRLSKARVRNYRSIHDTEFFEIEFNKTILVGPNEAGKTAVLQALQQINPPEGIKPFDALRDYPRANYNDITTNNVDPKRTTIVEAWFTLEDEDKSLLPEEYRQCVYVRGRYLNNRPWARLEGGPSMPTLGDIREDLLRLAAYVDKSPTPTNDEMSEKSLDTLANILNECQDHWHLVSDQLNSLRSWIDEASVKVDESNSQEMQRAARINTAFHTAKQRSDVLKTLWDRLPVFVLFNNYYRVRPSIHLEHLAQRLEENMLDDEMYDYGNSCLLKLLGFEARELSNLGKAPDPSSTDTEQLQSYKDQLDKRRFQLNAASVRLTKEICSVWNPDTSRSEADKLKLQADGQYLKVIVEDDLGVEIELDQRSEGFQWLVSFFIVFFAEAADRYKNAILLLDEPGLSLHGLKQREFRETISRLAESNQVIYTTHSPFLVGPNELDLVRVVEMADRSTGTKVHTNLTANDPAAMFPLQEALGYDLAQSLFAQQRNLVLEGLTDLWYLEATSQLLREGGIVSLNEKISPISANSASKVAYFATILHSQNLKVAALLDSDAEGDKAAAQDNLVHRLGNKNILRTKDSYQGDVSKPEIEDLLRDTLIKVAKEYLEWDVESDAANQPKRPIAKVFESQIEDFSKYKLAKAFIRWTRESSSTDLQAHEISQFKNLIELINKALK